MQRKYIILIAVLVFLVGLYFFSSAPEENPTIPFPTIEIGDTVIQKDIMIYAHASPIYIEKDTDEAVLIIHGFLASPEEVKELAEYLSDEGFAVFAPLMEGHGTSSKSLESVRWEVWKSEGELYYEALSKEYEKVHVIGFSLGSLTALSLAQDYDLASLTVISTPLVTFSEKVNIPDKTRELIAKTIPSVRKPGANMDVTGKKTNPNIPLHTVNEVIEYSAAVEKSISLIDEPLLVIQGNFDLVAHAKGAEKLMNETSSKQKDIFYVNSMHSVLSGLHQEEVFSMVKLFLK